MSRPADPARTLALLLGPAGPELGCDECFDELDRHVEAELRDGPGAGVPGMRAHLAGCPACLEEYRSLRDLLIADG